MSNSAVYFRGNEATALTPFIVLTGFGTFAALIGLGVAVRRTSALPSGYGSLPLAMDLRRSLC